MAEKPFDPQNPLADEDSSLPSEQLHADYEEQKNASYEKHLADSIRAAHPELKDASDKEAFNVVHKVEVPDASKEEYFKVLGKLYGDTWKAPKAPPLVSVTQPSEVGSALSDFAVSGWRDLTAIPKGISELFQGVAETAPAALQGVKNTAFGAPTAPSEQLQKGEELFQKSQAHLVRGGAFAAGLIATDLTAGAINPMTEKLGSSLIPKIAGKVLKSSASVGAFSGTYEAAREAAKPDPSETWNAFTHGLSSGAKFGAILGLGAGVSEPIIAGLAKGIENSHPLIQRAMKAGEATATAKTLPEAKAAAMQVANAFDPEWTPPETPPSDFAHGLIVEMHGEDVANSEAGKKAISLITKKINKYQADLIKNAFKEPGIQEGGTGFLESESPQAAALKKQRVTEQGPVWIFGIETKPGTVEVHNVAAPSQGAATELAETRAKALGGKLSGEVAPEYERQTYERRTTPGQVPTEERRTGPRREDELKQLQQINEQAKTEVKNVETMDRDSLVKAFQESHPNQPLAYEDTEQLRDVMRREAQARLQGTSSLLSTEIPKAKYEMATQAEVTKILYSPKFEEEFTRLRDQGATDAEIEHILRKAHQERYGSELASNEPGKVHAGFDPSLIRKLASKMYQNGLDRIIPKELVQNAIDSVRGVPDGKISVDVKTLTDRSIEVTDNGTGMSPETVQHELVDLGSSLKPEGASGGFGLAKAALFSNAEKIHIETVADVNGKRIQTTLTGSGEDWSNPKRGLNFNSKEVALDTPTGTKIKLNFPQKDSEGNNIGWSLYNIRNYGAMLNTYKQLNIPIDFKVDGDSAPSVYNIKPKLIKEFNTPGAKINFYSSGDEISQNYPRVQVLNNGIPQFDVMVALMEPIPLPRHLIVDVKSTVDPSSVNYPFTTSREALSTSIEDKIKHFVAVDLTNEAINKEKEVFKNAIVDAPKIGKWKVIDPSGKRDKTLIADISNTGEYEHFLSKIQNSFDILVSSLKKLDQSYENVKLTGLSTGSGHLGININGLRTTGDVFNHILINPWTIMDEVSQRIKAGITPPEELVKDFIGQVASTLEHELAHQTARGHDVAFSGELTRNIGHIGTKIVDVFQELMKGVQDEPTLFTKILKHSEDLQRDLAGREDKNIFAKVSDSSTGNRGPSDNPNVPQSGQEGRIKPEETVSPSNANTPENLPASPKRTGNLSPVEQARIRFDIPPKGEDARQAYEVWKQSVLKQHEKTVKKFKLLRDMHRETTGKEVE